MRYHKIELRPELRLLVSSYKSYSKKPNFNLNLHYLSSVVSFNKYFTCSWLLLDLVTSSVDFVRKRSSGSHKSST